MDIRVLASSSAGNCYKVSDGQTNILLECGILIAQIREKLNFKLNEIDACLLSHAHGDHSRSVKDIIKAGIDVYCSLPTAESLGIQDSHRVQIVEPRAQYKVGSFIVMGFEVQHDCPGAMGYLIQSTSTAEKLVFITDSYYSRYVFKNLTHVMIEANFDEDIVQENIEAGKLPEAMRNRLLHSHFSLENVKDFLRANDLSKVQGIWLLHLSNGNSDAERFKQEIAQLTGKVVTIC